MDVATLLAELGCGAASTVEAIVDNSRRADDRLNFMIEGVYSKQILVFVSHPHIPIEAGRPVAYLFFFPLFSGSKMEISFQSCVQGVSGVLLKNGR